MCNNRENQRTYYIIFVYIFFFNIDGGDRTVDDRDIELTLDVNLKGLILCTRLGFSSMRKRGVAGHIVSINR